MANIYVTADGRAFTAGDGTLLTLSATLFDELGLITDRTEADKLRWRELRDKGWQNMSESEKSEWLTALKGSYNYVDMNRVEMAVEYLSERLNADGYLSHPVVKTSWNGSEKPLRADFDRYYGNVAILRELLSVYLSTPPAPTTAKKLNHRVANDLEQILVDVYDLTNKVERVWLYSDDIFCGEV